MLVIVDPQIDATHYSRLDYPGEPIRNSWQLDMSFDRGDRECKFPYCWIKYRISDEATVEDVESMAEAIYIANGGVPYGD